ncbi:MAG: hypothetical protein HKP32_01880, partial [Woeseia sp.]|nr:hypothetical protein [Woeseia sp.]
MNLQSKESFHLGDRIVYPLQGVVTHDGKPVHLQPKVMSVLLCLAEQAGEVVTREEIVRQVWKGRAVSDESLTRCISELRLALGDHPKLPEFLQTIPKIGYRLVKNVEIGGDINAIAVIPFDSLNNTVADESFCDGLSEEILLAFSRIPDLRVAARTSSFSFKGKHADIPTIGRALHVDAILEGSVGSRRKGWLQVNVRLINVHDGFPIWVERYEREARELFDIQEDIARAVSKALEIDILHHAKQPLVKKPTQNVNAYSLYLRGRSHWYRRSYDALMQAIEYFNQAIEEDPNYANAYSGLAESWVLLAIWGYIDLEQPVAKARAAAERALELDPSLPGTHAAMGVLAHYWDWDWQGARDSFEEALRLDPSYSTARNWYSVHLADLGHIDESFKQLDAAAEHDSLNVIINAQYAYTNIMAHRFDAAIEAARHALSIDQTYIPALFYIGWAQQLSGNAEAALAQFLRVAQPLPVFRQILAAAYALADYRDEALKILEELEATRAEGK